MAGWHTVPASFPSCKRRIQHDLREFLIIRIENGNACLGFRRLACKLLIVAPFFFTPKAAGHTLHPCALKGGFQQKPGSNSLFHG
jgi:hypothetical protein